MKAVEVGQRIREVRRKLGLTQAEFGRWLGVTNISVARYEAGRIPRFNILREIARFGGVTVGWILQGVPVEESSRASEKGINVTDIPEPVEKLLSFLRKEAVKLDRLPKKGRKRYEERLDELVSRITRELQEYRRLLQGRS
jgi:transcriptional regulator with XRE-family HTH domain